MRAEVPSRHLIEIHSIVMAGLEPATQWPRVGAAGKSLDVASTHDALGGRVALRLPGHDGVLV
jgi:hypothetical protein